MGFWDWIFVVLMAIVLWRVYVMLGHEQANIDAEVKKLEEEQEWLDGKRL